MGVLAKNGREETAYICARCRLTKHDKKNIIPMYRIFGKSAERLRRKAKVSKQD